MSKLKKSVLVCLCLVLSFGWLTPITTEAATITDVKPSNSKYTAVKWAVDNGVMETYKGGKFQTHTLVTEAQLLSMIAQLDQNYSYSQSIDMYYNYYSELNLPLDGLSNAKKRYANVSRGQFARIIAALNGLDLSEPQAIQYLYTKEITTGTTGKKTYNDYQPNKNITRGDIAVFFYRIAKQGGISSVGLTTYPSGKDNSQITLPTNFMSNGTVEFDNNGQDDYNDWSNHPNVNKEVKSIKIENPEVTANGVDSTLIKIDLKDSFGNEIEQDESLQFRVKSEIGAKISSTSTSSSGAAAYAYTDGGELSVYVTAPKLDKSLKDTITFELVNNDDPKYATFKDKQIEVVLRYVPKAELRITYEVYDPEDPENASGNGDSGVKPASLPDLNPGTVIVKEIDLDRQTFYGKGDSKSDDAIAYEDATLRFGNRDISAWLFEKIVESYGEPKLTYSIDHEGRPVYDIHTDDIIKTLFEPNNNDDDKDTPTIDLTTDSKIVLYLIDFIPEQERISLLHYDSVKAISGIYDRVSEFEKKNLGNLFSEEISTLEAAEEIVDELKLADDLKGRPEGYEKYTKIIVSLVAPGGKVITDYRGKVRLTFNGESKLLEFSTNTTNHLTNTGHAGAAVAYYDGIIYGQSEVTAELLPLQDGTNGYSKILKSLFNQKVTETIFTNPMFGENSCEREVEVAYVIDQSGSMRKNDPTNHVAVKTKQLIQSIDAANSIAVRFSTTGTLEKKGDAQTVAQADIYKASTVRGGTNIASGVDVAISNFSTNTSRQKSIILVSDGITTQKQINQVIQKAKDNDNIRIYTVAVGKQADTHFDTLKQIAEETGGKFYHISEIEQLHTAYKNITSLILCEDPPPANFCNTPSAVFSDAEIEIRRNNVTMTAIINTNCENVNKVTVRFNSVYGSYNFDLIDRGQNVHRATQSVTKFQNFNLYNEVEFLAYDESGNLIGSKTVTIQ